ncbi:MAG: hypothetical protein IJ644_07790 [Oscillospiraceae bacterium]|nr:hypothetical protein [Oscillospiraceae bacterium]
MNHNLLNQDKNTASPEKKKMILALALSALTAVTAGILLAYQLKHNAEESHKLENTVPETSEETSILETDLSAAASVQKEITDMISESVRESVSEPVLLTEYITEPEFSVSESVSEVVISSETETLVSAETVQTAPVQETQASSAEESFGEPDVNTTALPTERMTVTSAVIPPSETVTESVTETSVPAEKKIYRSVLEHIFKYQRFQEDEFSIVNDSDIYENEFAVYDVDNDGIEELIIRWANTSVASVAGIVYSYDSEGNVYRKLKTTPYLRFYSNGVIEADSAHHSALAGDFWAYSLYQYDDAEKLYKEAGCVDAWDKSVTDESDYAQETFPDYADVSNTGFVYFISSDEEGISDPMDVTEYQTWHDSYIGNAVEINLPFRKMTETNIAQVDG